MPLFPVFKQKRLGRKFLFKNIDMRYSFDMLSELAVAKGVDLENGDIAYFENVKQNRRKVLIKKEDVIYCLYWMKVRGQFIAIDAPDGEIKRFIDFTK